MGFFQKLFGSRGGSASAARSSAARTPAELRDRLWRVASGHGVKELVDSLSDQEASTLVESIDLDEIPLNAFCTDRFQHNGLDDRMVAVTFVALRLVEAGRMVQVTPLLQKIQRKFERKIERGVSAQGPAHDRTDPWRMGESLMLQTHRLAREIGKCGSRDAMEAILLEAILLDFPQRLESAFWLAAARHNLYMSSGKDATAGRHAIEAMDRFATLAAGRVEHRDDLKALQNLRRENYTDSKDPRVSADVTRADAAQDAPAHAGSAPQLTTGISLSGTRGQVSTAASKADRAGKCRDCGTMIALADAREVCLDWDGVDAYHFYCPRCYRGTQDAHYYTGQLLGANDGPVIDQHSWERER